MKSARTYGILVAVLGLKIAVGQTPPANDNFTNAILLTGKQVSFSGILSNATIEGGESHLDFGATGSVWWKWVPASNGPVVLQVTPNNQSGGRIDARVDLFRGNTLSNLDFLGGTTLDIPAGRFLVQSLYVPTNSYYYFRISGKWQGSFNAQLTASTGPTIVQQPQDSTTSPYAAATFSALAAGIPRPAYQWMFNGTPLPGQTGAVLLLYNIQTNVAGGYSVIASNSGGTVQSATAWLTVRATNPVPVVTMLGPTNGSRVFFLVRGEPGRHYKSETTYDLNDWNLGGPPIAWWGQATNVFTVFSTYLLSMDAQFVAVSLDTPTDGCIAQLQAMDSALNFYAVENGLGSLSTYTLQNLAPYFPGGVIPACPGHGTYAPGATVTNGVDCSLGNAYGGPYDGGHHWP
jgi:hypothetical protein